MGYAYISVEGSYYDMGLALGQKRKDNIHQIIARYRRLLENKLKTRGACFSQARNSRIVWEELKKEGLKYQGFVQEYLFPK